MRVILRADVPNVGLKGDIIDVADGYARNYLLPKGWAIGSTAGAESQAQAMRRSRDVKDAAARGAAEEVAKALVPSIITIPARTGSEGRLFGSVTTSEIADAISVQTSVEVDRRHLHLDEPIKTLGTHLVPAKLHAEVEFPVTVEVVEG